MKRSARGWFFVLVMVAACGGDDEPGEKDAGNGGNSTGNNTGDDDANGGSSNSTGERMPVTDADNCAEDVATTPGIDCKGVVACGGTPAEPHACPLATHTCCVTGIPTAENVTCYTGKDSCEGSEGVTPCDGPEDCGDGDVCCVTLTPAPRTACVPASDCQGTVFCHTDDDCKAGQSCPESSISPFWGYCN